jgi:hypothetical protein
MSSLGQLRSVANHDPREEKQGGAIDYFSALSIRKPIFHLFARADI